MKDIKQNNFFKMLILIIFVILTFTGCSTIQTYNSLSNKQEDVYQAKSKIDISLQERYDLIPNVVSTVKGYMNHESEVFTKIADARSKIGSNNKETKENAQSELDSSISRLLVLSENYPELKSDSHAKELMSQLEMLETRILVARKDYNEAATVYNKKIKIFPNNIFAKIFNFKRFNLYESDSSASKAPSVNFDK